MNFEKIKDEIVIPQLSDSEELIGYFRAIYTPSLWWVFFIGPLIMFGSKAYIIVVTDEGLHFNKFNLMNKPICHDFFKYEEISELLIQDRLLSALFKVSFTNGRKIKLAASIKGVEKIPKLNEEMKNYISKRVVRL